MSDELRVMSDPQLLRRKQRGQGALATAGRMAALLARCNRYSLLAHCGDSFDHELQAVAAPLGAGDGLFHVFEGVGIVELVS